MGTCELRGSTRALVQVDGSLRFPESKFWNPVICWKPHYCCYTDGQIDASFGFLCCCRHRGYIGEVAFFVVFYYCLYEWAILLLLLVLSQRNFIGELTSFLGRSRNRGCHGAIPPQMWTPCEHQVNFDGFTIAPTHPTQPFQPTSSNSWTSLSFKHRNPSQTPLRSLRWQHHHYQSPLTLLPYSSAQSSIPAQLYSSHGKTTAPLSTNFSALAQAMGQVRGDLESCSPQEEQEAMCTPLSL